MNKVTVWLTGLWKKPPFIFPCIAIGHLFWLGITSYGLKDSPFGKEWIGLAWLLAYTVCWIAVCDLRKWGAMGYVIITMLNQGLYLAFSSDIERKIYCSSLWMIDIMFCFFILFFFKKFK